MAQVLQSGLATCYWLLMPGLAQRYSPPELFGTVYGAIFGLIGLFQMVATPLQNALADAIAP